MERERIRLRRDLARYELMLRMAWDVNVVDEIEAQRLATRVRLEELDRLPEARPARFTVIAGGRTDFQMSERSRA